MIAPAADGCKRWLAGIVDYRDPACGLLVLESIN
jgi:hypothetical protein